MSADHMAPLDTIFSGNPKNLTWSTEQQSAFINTKRIFSDAATLTFPQPGVPLVLNTDANNNAIGAVLEYIINTIHQPLAFFIHSLNNSTFDREQLAVHNVIHHFKHMIEGVPFTIQTDHQPVITALTKTGYAWSGSTTSAYGHCRIMWYSHLHLKHKEPNC